MSSGLRKRGRGHRVYILYGSEAEARTFGASTNSVVHIEKFLVSIDEETGHPIIVRGPDENPNPDIPFGPNEPDSSCKSSRLPANVPLAPPVDHSPQGYAYANARSALLLYTAGRVAAANVTG